MKVNKVRPCVSCSYPVTDGADCLQCGLGFSQKVVENIAQKFLDDSLMLTFVYDEVGSLSYIRAPTEESEFRTLTLKELLEKVEK